MPRKHIGELALECGFELCGVTPALPSPDFPFYTQWVEGGFAGEMRYLTDRRSDVRSDPRLLLPSARSIICVGKLYNGPEPYSTTFNDRELAWISRYAWGTDYHDVLRSGLAALAAQLGPQHEYKICVDTAPLLERSYARAAGLGWIGKNTCLINEPLGSWFFLGELLTSLELESGQPAPDRCGTCSQCIEACPTAALTPYQLDSTRCISYFTIELRNPIPEAFRDRMGTNVYGCDICQDVCPWNRRAPVTQSDTFAPRTYAPPLARLAALSEPEFRELFRATPIPRAKYAGFLRNVALAMGNSGLERFREPLEQLARNASELAAEAARWALTRLPARS